MSEEPEFKLVARTSPYSDGSGYQATVTVEDAGDGVKLQIDMAWRIPIGEWPALRRAVDDLVEAAGKRTSQRIKAPG